MTVIMVEHTDSDLRRNSNTSGLLQYQPVGSQVDFDAIKARSTLLPDDLDGAIIRVGIAVYAAGRDPETLKSLDSQPVHIGSVSIGTPLADTDR